MAAFAANSLLNRAALADGTTGPAAFAALRMTSGALCLAFLALTRGGLPPVLTPRRLVGAGSLSLYMLGFSFAYVALDAGLGALLIFGVVQVTMFTAAVAGGERPPAARWIGAALAFGGLVWLVSPGSIAPPDPVVTLLMVAAGIGWGIYSLAGRRATDPMAETAANFIASTPLALLVWAVVADAVSAKGATLAVVSGAITSGLGYALWYSVLPRLEASIAALAQLTVPVIAIAGGVLLLGEVLTLRIVLASAVILGGVAFGVLAQRRIGSRAS
jgi:drug/metabolite transporter (DMT)-like permease